MVPQLRYATTVYDSGACDQASQVPLCGTYGTIATLRYATLKRKEAETVIYC